MQPTAVKKSFQAAALAFALATGLALPVQAAPSSVAAVMSPGPPPLFFSRKFQLAWTRAEERTRKRASPVIEQPL